MTHNSTSETANQALHVNLEILSNRLYPHGLVVLITPKPPEWVRYENLCGIALKADEMSPYQVKSEIAVNMKNL